MSCVYDCNLHVTARNSSMPVEALQVTTFRRYTVMSTNPSCEEDDTQHQRTSSDSLSQPEMVLHQLYEMLDHEVAGGSSNSRGAIVVMSAVAAAGVRDDGGPVSQLAADYTVSHLHQASENLSFPESHWNVPELMEDNETPLPASVDGVEVEAAANPSSDHRRWERTKKTPADSPDKTHVSAPRSPTQRRPIPSVSRLTDADTVDPCSKTPCSSNTSGESNVETKSSEQDVKPDDSDCFHLWK